MMQDSDDRQLRALFHEELGNDGTDAPEFATIWANAVRRRDSRVRTFRAFTLAAVLIVVATIAFFLRPPLKLNPTVASDTLALESRELPWRSTILLTEWRAPSDAFLPAELQP